MHAVLQQLWFTLSGCHLHLVWLCVSAPAAGGCDCLAAASYMLLPCCVLNAGALPVLQVARLIKSKEDEAKEMRDKLETTISDLRGELKQKDDKIAALVDELASTAAAMNELKSELETLKLDVIELEELREMKADIQRKEKQQAMIIENQVSNGPFTQTPCTHCWTKLHNSTTALSRQACRQPNYESYSCSSSAGLIGPFANLLSVLLAVLDIAYPSHTFPCC